MTIQTLFNAWQATEIDPSVNPPATAAEIQAAETKIGTALPPPLYEVYQLFNGGWRWDLEFFTALKPKPYFYSLTDGNEQFIEDGWHIPKEIRLFAGMGGEETFGIWLPCCGNPIYNHPIIEVGELPGEDGCMGIAGTNLVSFLRGWSAYRMMMQHIILKKVDKPKELEFLGKLQVPQSLRYEHFDESQYERTRNWEDVHFTQLRKWADPQLPDPSSDSYDQQYTISDLKRIFGET